MKVSEVVAEDAPQPGDGILVVIPVRGGSKGVPRKNLRDVGGKPLVVWTIEQALAVPGEVRVVVSTDDPEIADVARSDRGYLEWLLAQKQKSGEGDNDWIFTLQHHLQN